MTRDGSAGTRRKKNSNKQCFISRQFDYTLGRLTLKIYRPLRARAGWYGCEYKLLLNGETIAGHAVRGEDALQSLLLALGLGGVEVELAIRRNGGRVSPWLLEDLKQLDAKGNRSRRHVSSGPKSRRV